MFSHPSLSLNNKKNCREISENKIAVCGKTEDSNLSCSEVLVAERMFQFSDMRNESERYRDTIDGLLGPKADL